MFGTWYHQVTPDAEQALKISVKLETYRYESNILTKVSIFSSQAPGSLTINVVWPAVIAGKRIYWLYFNKIGQNLSEIQQKYLPTYDKTSRDKIYRISPPLRFYCTQDSASERITCSASALLCMPLANATSHNGCRHPS